MQNEVTSYADYRSRLQKQSSQSGVALDEQQIHDSYMRMLARDTLLAAQEQIEVSKKTLHWCRSAAITLGVAFLLIGLFGSKFYVLR